MAEDRAARRKAGKTGKKRIHIVPSSDPSSSSSSSDAGKRGKGMGKGKKPRFRDLKKLPRKMDEIIKRLKKQPQPQPTKTRVIETGPKGVPIIMPDYGIGTTGLLRKPFKKDKSGLTINMKQIQNEKARRRTKAVKKSSKSVLTAARKRYTKVKKGVVKALRAGKKKQYDEANKQIKQLPPAQRKAARTRIRAQMKSKLDALLKKIRPASSYAHTTNVESGVSALRKMKW
jgi:hypothetical protein